jgi:hypothetical protein
MSSIHSLIISAVESEPGIGPGQVADVIGQDKSYVRRVMKGMAVKGAIRAEVNGNGYAFFPANGSASYSMADRAIKSKSAPINGAMVNVTPPSFDSRLAQTPSTSTALIVPGTVQFMPGDRRGRALGQFKGTSLGAWDIVRPNGFGAFNDDPAELGHSYDLIEKAAIREGITLQQNEILQLRGELAAKDAELAEVKREAETDQRWSAGCGA